MGAFLNLFLTEEQTVPVSAWLAYLTSGSLNQFDDLLTQAKALSSEIASIHADSARVGPLPEVISHERTDNQTGSESGRKEAASIPHSVFEP